MTSLFLRSLFVSSLLLALAGAAAAQTQPAQPEDQAAAPDAGAAPAGSVDDMEAAVLGGPAPAPGTPGARPAPPPPGRPAARHRRRGTADETGVPGEGDEMAFAVELGTSSFASGTLQGGLFLGVRLPVGFIVGGTFDIAVSSADLSAGPTVSTFSSRTVSIGAGARYALLTTADRRVDLYGAGDLAFVTVGADSPGTGGGPAINASASGFRLAFGPGLHFWVHEQLALGYLARVRWTRLSGDAGAFDAVSTAVPDADATTNDVVLEGVFQILALF